MKDLKSILSALAGAATLAAPALPALGASVARILAAALGAAAALIDQGAASDAEIIASIRRVGRIDTSVEDAALDALIAALPSRSQPPAETAATLHGLLASHVGRQTLSDAERKALVAAAQLARAVSRGELVPAMAPA